MASAWDHAIRRLTAVEQREYADRHDVCATPCGKPVAMAATYRYKRPGGEAASRRLKCEEHGQRFARRFGLRITSADDMEAKADAANRMATFEAMEHEEQRPTITVAGVHVAAYVDPETGNFVVSIDKDHAEQWIEDREVTVWFDDKDCSVPIRMSFDGDDLDSKG
jgi:hypothetical protein